MVAGFRKEAKHGDCIIVVPLCSQAAAARDKKIGGGHLFDFPESRQRVEEKEENFQHGGCQSRFLVARLGRSIALDT